MPGPAPTHRPAFTPEQLAACERLARQHTAPQAQVARARLALLLDAEPDLDHAAAARRLGRHPNWVRAWRRTWATEGFRLTDNRGAGASPPFPPLQAATVRALACELPARREQPLARYSTADLARLVAAHPDAPPMSRSTVWRTLDRDALKPWRHQSWLLPRDPAFAEKAGRVLDLYAGWWEGQPLDPADCLLSADEKTSIQARVRCHPTTPPRPGQAMRVEHEYARGGALAYLAAWDVRRGGVIGRCEATTGIAPFGRLVEQVMQREPYRSAPRVFWVVDNGSSHRGVTAVARLRGQYPNLILVHLPTHASWLNQVELYFSIVQRNEVASLMALPRIPCSRFWNRAVGLHNQRKSRAKGLGSAHSGHWPPLFAPMHQAARNSRKSPEVRQLQLHERPALDNVAVGARLGKHENWARYWRKVWATEGFRLTDKGGQGRKPAFSPPAGRDGQGAGLRAAGAPR